ncbi:MAG: DUF389 domain-containing protein [Flavobacteriales bacterium]|nr:DUF389 domain-containing protein [Flavobacteriales bacterium]
MEQENQQQEEQLKENVKFSFSNLISALLNYFKVVISIRQDVDYEGSVESIKKDIDFKGVNVWVLGTSIAIASIGLNVNSTAVIIGAMLISPLMGPIVGIGLSVGINDFKLLIRSLKNLGTAVLISVVVSAIYFLLTPFGEVQSELIARTRPNLLDVLIAMFGGIALIVAKTKKGTVASVIFGVAIATALMPPLCTAGYGLANGNWKFFMGAFYLFLINSVFIALSTWMIVKYLKFPLATYMNPDRQKKVRIYILVISLLIIVPSGFTFWNTIQERIFANNAERFITENFEFEGTWINKKVIQFEDKGPSKIDVYLMGDIITDYDEKKITGKLAEYDLKNVDLKIHQFKDKSEEIAGKLTAEVKSGILEEIYQKNEQLLNDKDAKITFLEDELLKLRSDTIPFTAIKKEMKVQYPNVIKMSYGKTISTNFNNKQDTTPTFYIHWKPDLPDNDIATEKTAIQKWLRVRLSDDKTTVVSY